MYIKVSNVSKYYGENVEKNRVLNKVNVSIDKGDICLILGPSGSGKSTLLNLIGGLDSIEAGDIVIDDMNIAKLSSKKLAEYRRNYLGFIFQFYNLIPNLTVKENIKVCEYLADKPLNVDELISLLGLEEHKNKFPAQLSGGQQQRCAIARAIVKNPKILLCDEPTGALDYKSSKDILCLLEEINKKYGMTIVMVTHNAAIKAMANQIIEIKDGEVRVDEMNDKILAAKNIEW